MSTNQFYSLTWGDFGTSLVSAVQLLRCHGELVDVTLAAGGRCFPAHKIVLCAASPFLLDLLKNTPCKHPVVMLPGVTASDLEALLEFVYRGEVSIDPNQLPSLLQAAHCLNIQGLAPATGNELHHTIKAVIDMNVKTDEPLAQSTSTTPDVLTRDIINSYLPVRRRKRFKRKPTAIAPRSKWPRQNLVEITQNRTITTNTPSDVWTEPDINFSSSDSLLTPNGSGTGTNAAPAKVRSASDQPGTCPLCGAMLRQARNLRRHLLTSCKYRESADTLQTTGNYQRVVQNTSREPNLHQMQVVASTSQTQHLDSKTSVLEHIACGSMDVPE